MKHPPHLFTIEISFGPELPVFFEHYRDPEMAGQVLRGLKVKMFGSNGQIQSLKLWHQNKIISQYISTPPKPKYFFVPPPDKDGVRHIPPMTKGQRLMVDSRPDKVKAKAPKPKTISPVEIPFLEI